MTRWPIWRLLVRLELWVLAVAGLHVYRPVHEQFVVALLIAVVPVVVVIAMWAMSRGATEQRPTGRERPSPLELLVAATAAIASAGWAVSWTLQTRADLQRVDAMLGQGTIIVDVSLTGLSIGACLAALTLHNLLAVAQERLRDALQWWRRTHVTVTALHLAALFGAAWFFTRLPDPGTIDNVTLFERARTALHIYEYCRATVFPVQAFFAAMTIALTAAAHYAE